MKSLLIFDEEQQTETYQTLLTTIRDFLKTTAAAKAEFGVNQRNITYCKGCFSCWIKTPGECAIKDAANELNRQIVGSDLVLYISPLLFGQCGTNIKKVLERGLPNLLPFFITLANGSTMHPPRYEKNPRKVFIGCGERVTEPEKDNFRKILTTHEEVEVLFYTGEEDKPALLSALKRKTVS